MRRFAKALLLTLLMALSVLTSGCATIHLTEHQTPHRGRLGDAMKVAAGEQDRLQPRDEDESHRDEEEEERTITYLKLAPAQAAPTPPAPTVVAVKEERPPAATHPPNIGFATITIPVTHGGVHEIRESSFFMESAGPDSTSLGIAATTGSYSFTEGSLLDRATEGGTTLGWLVYVKHYFNDQAVFISPYLLAGFGGGYLDWDYRSPVTDAEGNEFRSDDVTYTDLRIGLGTELARASHVKLTISATAIWRFYSDTTGEGFYNDMFDSHFTPAWGASFAVRF